eukprot:TRINITY_DN34905_c0_g1_i1.p1 TRINITY_DN34905_c0_g1~~TRINITY_DN34905_c0_g1_i1.p1  ORF type:complete len:1073 (+),score=191.23 TRINITY_DN34905_c0_g1_i1:335-3553(+)
MLFIHQAPRSSTPSRAPTGDPRLSGRGRRSAATPSRRPSSAVGHGADRGSATSTPVPWRGHAGDRARASTPSRPGSASSGMRPFAGRPQQTPPTSARAYGGDEAGQQATAAERQAMARPLSPHGRSSTPQPGRGPQSGPVRVPSNVGQSLPLHVAPVGRPRTPTSQRRPPATGQHASSGGNQWEGGEKPWDGGGPSAHQSSGRSDGSGGGNNNLTTVISSALDYKRFLDRRKQLIQQQVETAQQASGGTRGHDAASVPARPSSATKRVASAAEKEGYEDGYSDGSPRRGQGGSGGVQGHAGHGWNPGAAGPVKASHLLQTKGRQTSGGGQDQDADDARPMRSASAGGTPSDRAPARRTSSGDLLQRTTSKGGSTNQEEEDALTTPTSARSASPQAAQQQLRRAGTTQEQPVASRAATPTRYTQSAALQGANLDSCADSSSSRPVAASRATSMPVGGARQACMSLGNREQGQLNATAGETEIFDDRREDGASYGTAASASGAPARTRTSGGTSGLKEASIDGLLRDVGDSRPSTGTLAGSTVEDYIIGKQIGQGAYATVFFGLHKESNRKVAIKIYEKYKLLDPQRRKSVRCEIRLMERMRHPNIVVFHDALDTAKQIYIVMDFVGGGSLHHFLKKRPGRRLEDQVAKRLFYQVCQGLRYLHDRHIVHRDIKLENLLLDESGVVKIIDFGFSTIVPPGKKLKVFCGTPSYMAPEIVARKEYSGFCADIWAAGVLLYALLCGSFPFRGQNDRDLYRKIVRGVFHVPDLVGEGARNLLGRILTPDMSRRPTIDETLADVWLSSHRDDLYTNTTKGCSGAYQPNSSTSSTATTAAPSSDHRPSSSSAGPSARDMSATGPDMLHSSSGRAPISRAQSAGSRGGHHHGGGGGSDHHMSAAHHAQAHSAPSSSSQHQQQQQAPREAASSSLRSGGGTAEDAARGNVAAAAAAAERPGTADLRAAAAAVAASSSGAAIGPDQAGGQSWTDAAEASGRATPQAGYGADRPVEPARGSAAAAARAVANTAHNRRIEEEAISKLERLGYPREEILRQLKDESSHLCKLYHRFLKALTAWDSKK